MSCVVSKTEDDLIAELDWKPAVYTFAFFKRKNGTIGSVVGCSLKCSLSKPASEEVVQRMAFVEGSVTKLQVPGAVTMLQLNPSPLSLKRAKEIAAALPEDISSLPGFIAEVRYAYTDSTAHITVVSARPSASFSFLGFVVTSANPCFCAQYNTPLAELPIMAWVDVSASSKDVTEALKKSTIHNTEDLGYSL